MARVCRTCSRVNPDEALYCFHDGAVLNGHGQTGPIAVGARPFPTPFVFPSGRQCRSFDEMVLACDSEWAEARGLLKQGYLESFLAALGRTDLAQVARRAARAADPDRGLEQFLEEIPSDVRQPARLVVQPLEVNLGQLSRQGERKFLLIIENGGMGLLHGTIACERTPWLALGDGPGVSQRMFHCLHDGRLTVQVVPKALRAGSQPLEGRIVIETNGGSAVVQVRAEVPTKPFPEGILAGAMTPRQLAEKARAAPKAAAPLFEKGAVAKWYEDNGWAYPVQGPAASGLAAVQQYFEALGLAQPPRVEISTRQLQFESAPGKQFEQTLTVQTAEKRPVYAYAVSSVPWLQVGKPTCSGARASIPLRVSVPDRPGERLFGQVRVHSNGRQRFTVEVALTVSGKAPTRRRASGVATAEAAPLPPMVLPVTDWSPAVPALAAVPVSEVLPADEPIAEVLPARRGRDDDRGRGRSRDRGRDDDDQDDQDHPEREERRRGIGCLPLVPIAFLMVAMLLPFGHDLWKLLSGALGGDDDNDPAHPPRIALHFHDSEEKVTLGTTGIKPQDGPRGPQQDAFWEPSMRFGLTMVDDRGPSLLKKPRRLTFEEKGFTNNVCVKLDGNEWLFGERPFRLTDGRTTGDWPGRWKERDISLPQGAIGRKSIWIYDTQQVQITQTVQLINGPQTGVSDTCFVHYRIDNLDRFPHRVGLRFLLDTFIGENDGVPFLIPGEKQLCSTSRVFGRPEEVPTFLQALEHENLERPGTIAMLQLKLGGSLEPPTRVTLGAWPNPTLASRDPRCKQEKTLWDVPVFDIHTLSPADSCVTIYWDEKLMPPGGGREMGFTYGLGSVAGREGKGRLALTVGGSFAPGGEMTVTAYVNNPTKGQTVKLELPDGFELAGGAAEQTVPPPGPASRNSPVTWKVKAPRKEGPYTLKVQSSNGATQSQTVKIRAQGIFGN